MTLKMSKKVIIISLFFIVLSGNVNAFIVDHTCTDISKISPEWINTVKANLHIGYQHASHGRQLTEGMKELDAFMGDTGLFAISTDGIDRTPEILDIIDGSDAPGSWWYQDIGTVDRLSDSDDWVILTRRFLDDPAHSHINVIMWSWCSMFYYPNNDPSNPAVAYDVENYYIPFIEQLISEYGSNGSKILSGERFTPVIFVFMTGASSWGTGGRNYQTFLANKKIRQHCVDNNRILYDFYDIECYDPDENYFGDGEPNIEYYGE